jgi:hypothetical protein
MGRDVAFVEVRPPLPGEMAPGRSGHLVAVDAGGGRWVLRRGPDEAFAYALSERYFGGVVPRTVVVGRHGTAQEMVDGTTAHLAGERLLRSVRATGRALRGLAAMACLDLVMRNRDRHANNWGLGRDGGVWAFDNEVTGAPMTMRQAMRPIYRCVLADDPDFAPGLIDEVEGMLSAFLRDWDAPHVGDALPDLRQWRADLSSLGGT